MIFSQILSQMLSPFLAVSPAKRAHMAPSQKTARRVAGAVSVSALAALALVMASPMPGQAQSIPGLSAATDAAATGKAAPSAKSTATGGASGKTSSSPRSAGNPCAQYGAGFQQAPGSNTCVKVTGAVRVDAGSGGTLGNAPNVGTDIVTEGTPYDPWKVSR